MNSPPVVAAVSAATCKTEPAQRAMRASPQRTRVGMISLGCAKNLVDAEIMLGSVLQRGMEITSCPEDADVLVVNTCAFIYSAKEESIGAIRERTAAGDAGGGCVYRAGAGRTAWRDCRKGFGKTPNAQRPTLNAKDR